jgi:hypothetical protein
MSIDELQENVYEIRALLHIYEQTLSRPVSESQAYAAKSELRITKEELLKRLVEARKKVNSLGR